MKNNSIAITITAVDGGFTSTIGKATSGLKAFQSGVRNWTDEAKKLDSGLAGIAGRFAALFGGISTVAFAKSVFDAGLVVDRLDRSFAAITGSAAAANREMEFVKETSNSLGLEISSTANAYKSLMAAAKGSTLEGKDTREIFLGIAEAAAVLNLSSEQTEGALIAIGQMISKGNVQAEELRGQLGERLPGAFQIAAKAMGVSTSELGKLLEQGKVTAEDMLPKLAKALREQYGKAALEAGNSATAGVNRFQNAWLDFRATIANSGFMDVVTGKIRDLTDALNDPAVQQSAANLTKTFMDMAEATLQFAINHGEAIVKATAGIVALSALSRAAHLLTGIWKGLNAAMLITTGLGLIPYLARLNASLALTRIAALGVSGALGAAAGGALAFTAGLNIGEQIYKQTDEAEVALAKLRHEIDLTAAKYRQFASFTPASQETLFSMSERDLESYKQKLEGAFRYQSAVVSSLFAASREKNFWGQQTAEAQRAQVEYTAAKSRLGEIQEAMKSYGTAAEQMHRKAAEAGKSSAAAEKEAKTKSLEEIKRAYQEYATTVKRLQDEIAGKERSLAATLREMSRSGMKDFSAWKDRKKEAEEYLSSAKKAQQAGVEALKAGDQVAAEKAFASAREYAEQAERSFQSLNTEVVQDGKTMVTVQQGMKTAMDGVKSAGALGIEVMKQQEAAAKAAADAANEASGWKLGEAFTNAGKEAKALADVSETFQKSWQTAFVAMGVDAAAEIDKIDHLLNNLSKDRYIKVHVQEVQAKALGGVVHRLARGGSLPGYGGGDRVRALLEPGEFVVRKEAVAKYGLDYLYALNTMRLNDIDMIRARIGGLIDEVPFRQGFQTGGAVQGSQGKTINVSFNLPVQGPPIPFKMDSRFVNELFRQMKAMHRGRS